MNARLHLIHGLKRAGVLEAAELVYDAWWLRRALKRGTFAQHGEDLFMVECFAGKPAGSYVEVGANHPFKISNTYLLYRSGWRGVTVEPIRRLWRKHRRWRPGDIQLNCAAGQDSGSLTFHELTPGVLSTFSGEEAAEMMKTGAALLVGAYQVPVLTLREICQTHLAGKAIDLLSVDTEGHDLPVLQGADWTTMRPRLIITEERTTEAGAPDGEPISDFITGKGYRLLKKMGCNRIWEREA